MPFLLFLFLFFLFFYYNYSYYYTQNFLYILRRPRKFEDILTIDKVFGENLKGPLKISAKGKARQVILRFRKAFTVGCYFRERRKTALKNSRGSNHSQDDRTDQIFLAMRIIHLYCFKSSPGCTTSRFRSFPRKRRWVPLSFNKDDIACVLRLTVQART